MAENTNTDSNDKEAPAPAVDNATKDRVAGGLEEAKGRLKESAGALTGNERLKGKVNKSAEKRSAKRASGKSA